jgi:hypothetical protein
VCSRARGSGAGVSPHNTQHTTHAHEATELGRLRVAETVRGVRILAVRDCYATGVFLGSYEVGWIDR